MPMVKCVLLIPVYYNDGKEIPKEAIGRILDEIYEKFGGYTVAGATHGAYRMDDGGRADDDCFILWIAVEAEGIAVLKKMAARIAKTFKQESIWFEVAESDITLVRPEEESEET
jgi:hypothetical protein